MRETDRQIQELTKQIRKEYQQVLKETQKKLDDHFKAFEWKDEQRKRQLKEGKITAKEYKQWRAGQMATGKMWEQRREQIAKDLQKASDKARKIINGSCAEAYVYGKNFMSYSLENGFGADLSFMLTRKESVERIFRDNPELLPKPGRQMLGKLARGEVIKWKEGQLQSVVMQALLQGKSVTDLARDIMSVMRVKDMAEALRYARTAINGAENAGALDSLYEADDMSIEVEKEWMATLDERTREAHRELDGVAIPMDEPFENSIGKIMYPGDPDADDENYWNCRCTIVGRLKDISKDMSDTSWRNTRKMGDMSYEEWQDAKSQSQSIQTPLEIEKIMKMRYINDYKR